MIPVARTDISPALPSLWIDIDVSAYVDPGNTAGVLLEIHNTSSSARNWVVRKNGSGDTRYKYLPSRSHTWVAVGVDDNNKFEIKVATTEVDCYIVGYITKDEGFFFTNAIDKTMGTANDWIDVNISGDTGDDTAICAFLCIYKEAANFRYWGLRQNGSSDDRRSGITDGYSMCGAMMSVDENEIFEGWVNNLDVEFWLAGYLTANCSSWANAKDYATGTTGSWVATDMGSDIPSDNDGAFLSFAGLTGDHFVGIRKNGATSIDNYHSLARRIAYLWVELDTDRIAEQKIGSTSVDMYLWGYTSQPEAPPPEVKTLVQMSLV